MPKTSICERCGEAFKHSSGDAGRFCSRGCRQLPRITLTCAMCGTTFTTERQSAVYCSQDCRIRARSGMFASQRSTRSCAWCGSEFSPPPSGSDAQYCSRACYRSASEVVRESRCRYCDRPFRFGANTSGTYCSHDCARQDKAKQIRTCPICGKSYIYDQIAQLTCSRACSTRLHPTSIERAMDAALDAAGIDYVSQYDIGGKFVCDFALPGAMLIVECDGTYWHSLPRSIRRDKAKDAYLKQCGYTVLRFTETEIKKDAGACVQVVLDWLRSYR